MGLKLKIIINYVDWRILEIKKNSIYRDQGRRLEKNEENKKRKKNQIKKEKEKWRLKGSGQTLHARGKLMERSSQARVLHVPETKRKDPRHARAVLWEKGTRVSVTRAPWRKDMQRLLCFFSGTHANLLNFLFSLNLRNLYPTLPIYP